MSNDRVGDPGEPGGLTGTGIDVLVQSSAEQSGTPPGDRRFRPDVEGLRAIAVLLVVLFHAGFPGLSGGFVGVDVFFVISGFVITGLLLREAEGFGRASVVDFYARRCRRILPAALLVILVAVAGSYGLLGSLIGNAVANDGRWAAAYLVNFHFASTGTNYFTSFLPPSPLQNYWSLSVEEQFYIVYPTVFLIVARVGRRLSLRTRLTTVLGVIIVASYWYSIVETGAHPTAAYFSPFTRAWELALGGLVATTTPWLRTVPRRYAATGTWIGLGAICLAAFAFDGSTPYPGSLVALPVVGAGFIIAGGAAMPTVGAEAVLGQRPLQWLGRRSYSLYLWHWPILIIAAERVDRSSLPLGDDLLLLVLAMALSMATYRLIENPIRHMKIGPRSRGITVVLGVCASALVIGILTFLISIHSGGADTRNKAIAGTASLATVRAQVNAAPGILHVPPNLSPSLSGSIFDFGIPNTWAGCNASYGQVRVPACSFGDRRGAKLMVLYGDSHALMWAKALDDIAIRAKWRFVVLTKPGCFVGVLPIADPPGFGATGHEWVACDQWRRYATNRINHMDPNLLVVTQQVHTADKPDAWRQGLERALVSFNSANTTKVVLGNIPRLTQLGPDCLSRHTSDVQACTGKANASALGYQRAEESAATATGSRYIDVMPWFCSKYCTSIIGHFSVYAEANHVTNEYAAYLEGVLANALGLVEDVALPPVKPDLHTVLKAPREGASLSGSAPLDAVATANVRVTKVQFEIVGQGVNNEVIDGTLLSVGWVAFWNTSSVPNGSYEIQPIAFDAAGKSAVGKPVAITVTN